MLVWRNNIDRLTTTSVAMLPYLVVTHLSFKVHGLDIHSFLPTFAHPAGPNLLSTFCSFAARGVASSSFPFFFLCPVAFLFLTILFCVFPFRYSDILIYVYVRVLTVGYYTQLCVSITLYFPN